MKKTGAQEACIAKCLSKLTVLYMCEDWFVVNVTNTTAVQINTQ